MLYNQFEDYLVIYQLNDYLNNKGNDHIYNIYNRVKPPSTAQSLPFPHSTYSHHHCAHM